MLRSSKNTFLPLLVLGYFFCQVEACLFYLNPLKPNQTPISVNNLDTFLELFVAWNLFEGLKVLNINIVMRRLEFCKFCWSKIMRFIADPLWRLPKNFLSLFKLSKRSNFSKKINTLSFILRRVRHAKNKKAVIICFKIIM